MSTFTIGNLTLTVHLGVAIRTTHLSEALKKAAAQETAAILTQFPNREIWSHNFELNGNQYALSSRFSHSGTENRHIVEVDQMEGVSVFRTVLKPITTGLKNALNEKKA